jgi:putative transposase
MYVNILNSKGIRISMTENGDPLENAIAERVNGILKVEWIYDQRFESLPQVQGYVRQIIGIYNRERPHSSVEMLTPEQAHRRAGELQRKWKNYYPHREAG